MRAIWKGAVSFGLVSIPVRLYSATEERDVHFHQVHREDAGRVRYRRVCQIDGAEVAYSDIAKGYELPSGEMVILTDEDFQELPLPTSRIVDVLEFVPLAQVDPIYFAKSYYLEPDKQGVKPYVLLRDALERSEMVALVKVAIRTRETLGTLRVRDRVLVLETMVWPDEVRTPDFAFLGEDVAARPQELDMAESLISSMSGDFDPSQYHDQYREALEQVIEAKIQGRHVVPERLEAAPAERAVDLMAALRRSVEEAKRRRGEPAGEAAAEQAPARAAAGGAPAPKATPSTGRAAKGGGKAAKAPKAPAKKPAATKPAATKTPATKTPATKTPAGKTPAGKTPARKSAPAKTAKKASAPKKAAAKAPAKAAKDDRKTARRSA